MMMMMMNRQHHRSSLASTAARLLLVLSVLHISTTHAFVIPRPSSSSSSWPLLLSDDVVVGRITSPRRQRCCYSSCLTRRHVSFIIIDDDDEEEDPEEDDEEEEDEDEEDPYSQIAQSEFIDETPLSSSLTARESPRTTQDWGGALAKLRERVSDIESGKSQDPSNSLFRLMASQSPNQLIGNFVQSANPQVVSAMSGAIASLLGGLSNPAMGAEMVVKASGDKIGSLCFQLQMTGYMFRNAEYVLALKDIMNLRGSATMQDYKEAFEALDTNNSGFIEVKEIEALLQKAYNNNKEVEDGTKKKQPPAFEIKAFLEFFDKNKDGRISWDEFERGLGDMTAQRAADAISAGALQPVMDSEEDDDEEHVDVKPKVTGMIEIELEDGKIIEVEATDYIENLKREARELKEVLRREKGLGPSKVNGNIIPGLGEDMSGSLVGYISSRQGDVKSLTEGIRPEIVETMKRLVDFVLEGGPDNKKIDSDIPKDQIEMEIPGAALQQLAFWQLVLGYRLREAEATGDYLRLLENK